jgi:hypothetical protein
MSQAACVLFCMLTCSDICSRPKAGASLSPPFREEAYLLPPRASICFTILLLLLHMLENVLSFCFFNG